MTDDELQRLRDLLRDCSAVRWMHRAAEVWNALPRLLAAYDAVRAERDAARKAHSIQRQNFIDLCDALYGGRVPHFEYDPFADARKLAAAEQRAAEAEGLLLRVKSESASPTDLWHEIATFLSKQPAPEVKQAAKPEGGDDA